MSLGRRIKNIRASLGYSQKDFADRFGYNNNVVVSAWEGDKSEPPLKVIKELARLGGVTLDWLLTGEDSVNNPPRVNLDTLKINDRSVTLKHIPIVGVFSGGDPKLIYREDNILGQLDVMELQSTTNLFAVQVEGDSMIHPTNKDKSIEPGDFAIVDTSIPPMSGDIVAISLKNGRQMIKQFVVDKAGEIELRSYNKDEHPVIYINYSDIDAIYKVVWIQPKRKKP